MFGQLVLHLRRARAVIALALALTIGGALVAATGGATAAGADTPVTGFYLDLGASASLGFQPIIGEHHGGATDAGYANDLVAYESARDVTLDLVQLGCPGESTLTMMTGADRCYASQGSQLDAAVSYLLAHQDEPGLVTIDLGFNSIMPCLRDLSVDEQCVDDRLADVSSQLTTVVSALKDVAGPDVSFVGLDHYDPFVIDELDNDAAVAEYASQAEDAIERLNETLTDVYQDAGVAVARVGEVFAMHDHDEVATDEGTTPVNVERLCAWTWMCARPPDGPNIHPNDAGYAAIASAIEAVLPSTW